MICRYYLEGQKLNVADLNEITVLIDRSETALTEVALNTWPAKLVGPPHFHTEKDQLFYITSGTGTVNVAQEKYKVSPGKIVFVPAGVVHQTVAGDTEPLSYMLFNFFLNPEKEGHGSFADHIEKVKHIRKQQAETGTAEIAETAPETASEKSGKFVENTNRGKLYEFGSNTARLLLDRSETGNSEALIVSWTAGSRGTTVAHEEKEQTFFILSGAGKVFIGDEGSPVKPGDVVFVPRNVPHTIEAGSEELTYLCLNTYVT